MNKNNISLVAYFFVNRLNILNFPLDFHNILTYQSYHPSTRESKKQSKIVMKRQEGLNVIFWNSGHSY